MKRISSIVLSVVLAFTMCFTPAVNFLAAGAEDLFEFTVDADNEYAAVNKYKYISSYDYTDVNIPDNYYGYPVTVISANAFRGAVALETVGIPHSVKEIGKRAFNSCSSLNDLVMPNSQIEKIGDGAFAYCTSFTEFTIPASVTSIGDSVFSSCDNLKKFIVEEGNSYYTAPNGVLYNKNQTVLIKIPSAYSSDTYTVPDGVTTLAADALYNTPSDAELKTLILPASLTTVGEAAVGENPVLEKIYYLGSAEDWSNVTIEEYGNDDLLPVADGGKLIFHSEHTLVEKSYTAPACTTAGSRISECSVCGTEVTEVLDALGHEYQAVVTEPTCTEGGYTVYTCSRCGDTYTADETAALGHDYKAVVTEPSCTEGGYTTYTCSRCGDTYTADETDALGHDYQAVVTEPSCTEGGFTTYTCSRCGDVYTADETAALGHDYQISEHKDASYSEAGYDKYTCTRCGDSYTIDIPKLEGIIIKVNSSELGSVEIIGGKTVEGIDGKLFDKGESYSLTATANDNTDFAGWTIGSRVITTDAVYTNTAYTHLEYTPLFVEKEASEEHTIVFLNKYGDILATEKAGNDIKIPRESEPEMLNLPGYVFSGWTKDGKAISNDEIRALTESAKIVADYTKETTQVYNITAIGAEITDSNGNAIDGTNLTFDTKVTVKFENAKAIKCGDDIVSYGDSYTLYIAGDIELTPVYEEIVEEEAQVKIIGANRVAGTDTKFNIYATRTVPKDWTVIDRGFIYGRKDKVPESKENINLDSLPSGVKACHGTPTQSNQFVLVIGVKSSIGARFYAYATINKGDETRVIISDSYDVIP